MNDFSRHLRREIAKSLDPKSSLGENPLRVIGLSPVILDLGLTDDELFAYCKNAARNLVVHFHPDRQGTQPKPVVEKQRRFSEAFDQLKNRALFNAALAEFKDSRAFDRAEEQASLEQVRMLQTRLEEAEAKLNEGATEKRQRGPNLDRAHRLLLNILRMSATRFAPLGAPREFLPVEQTASILAVHFRIKSCFPPKADQFEELKREHAELVDRENKYGESKQLELDRKILHSKLVSARLGAAPLGTLIQEAINSKAAVPEVAWNEEVKWRELGFGFRSPGLEDLPPALRPKEPESWRHHYRKGLEAIGEYALASRINWVTHCAIRLVELKPKLGYFRAGRTEERIVGSIFPYEVPEWAYRPKGRGSIKALAVREKLMPLVVENALLVAHEVDWAYSSRFSSDARAFLGRQGLGGEFLSEYFVLQVS